MSDEINRDIARKCDEDVSGAIHRNMQLVEGGAAKAQIAFMGAGSALGSAGGAFLALHAAQYGEGVPDEEAAEALWLLLRPMVVRAIARHRKEKGAKS